MIDIYVLDKNLNLIGVIDAYKSLIWANRYREVGDCELYLEANTTNLALLQEGYYLIRLDDSMVCRIRRVEIDTNSKDGNYLIVNGYDAKQLLDQRIVWDTMNCDGNLEDFIRLMINTSACNPTLIDRQFQKANGDQLLFLGNKVNFTEMLTEQISYKNVGEKIREYCQKYKWGYRVILSNNVLWFQLYKGTDRSDEVFFSNDYENLASTKYISDKTKMGNVALVAGAGEGSLRTRNAYGFAQGVDRYEQFVDAKDIAKTITWKELTSIYPTIDSGGQGYISGTAETGYTYNLNYVNIQIIDDDQLIWLKANYPDGTEITIDGNDYYQIYDVVIADLMTNVPEDNSPTTLRDLVYSVYLLNRGAEKLADYGEKVSFEGSVIPDITFTYKQDYFLGDLVTVENEFGITATARIVEVIEVLDENGYKMEPKFEYMEVL